MIHLPFSLLWVRYWTPVLEGFSSIAFSSIALSFLVPERCEHLMLATLLSLGTTTALASRHRVGERRQWARPDGVDREHLELVGGAAGQAAIDDRAGCGLAARCATGDGDGLHQLAAPRVDLHLVLGDRRAAVVGRRAPLGRGRDARVGGHARGGGAIGGCAGSRQRRRRLKGHDRVSAGSIGVVLGAERGRRGGRRWRVDPHQAPQPSGEVVEENAAAVAVVAHGESTFAAGAVVEVNVLRAGHAEAALGADEGRERIVWLGLPVAAVELEGVLAGLIRALQQPHPDLVAGVGPEDGGGRVAVYRGGEHVRQVRPAQRVGGHPRGRLGLDAQPVAERFACVVEALLALVLGVEGFALGLLGGGGLVEGVLDDGAVFVAQVQPVLEEGGELAAVRQGGVPDVGGGAAPYLGAGEGVVVGRTLGLDVEPGKQAVVAVSAQVAEVEEVGGPDLARAHVVGLPAVEHRLAGGHSPVQAVAHGGAVARGAGSNIVANDLGVQRDPEARAGAGRSEEHTSE